MPAIWEQKRDMTECILEIVTRRFEEADDEAKLAMWQVAIRRLAQSLSLSKLREWHNKLVASQLAAEYRAKMEE